MLTEHKDQVIALWEPLPSLSGCLITRVQDYDFERDFIFNPYPTVLHRVIASVAYDLARFADGGNLKRPDHLADLCFSISQSPGRLRCTFEDGDTERIVINIPQRQTLYKLLAYCLQSNRPVLVDEVRTPWNDADLQLLGNRVLGVLMQSQVRFL